MAKEVREATGEKTLADLDTATNKWRVRIGETKEIIEEANQFKNGLAEKGFADVVIVTEKKITAFGRRARAFRAVKIGRENRSSQFDQTDRLVETDRITPINANLREVIINGKSEMSKFSSLKPVAFGSFNERAVPVKLNGKAYRGRIEVFVNSRGTLTVVNVVPMEDYLLGVVPNELGLPSLEAQKAQAVAARTYAIANINGFGSQGFDLLPTVWSQVYGAFRPKRQWERKPFCRRAAFSRPTKANR